MRCSELLVGDVMSPVSCADLYLVVKHEDGVILWANLSESTLFETSTRHASLHASTIVYRGNEILKGEGT